MKKKKNCITVQRLCHFSGADNAYQVIHSWDLKLIFLVPGKDFLELFRARGLTYTLVYIFYFTRVILIFG